MSDSGNKKTARERPTLRDTPRSRVDAPPPPTSAKAGPSTVRPSPGKRSAGSGTRKRGAVVEESAPDSKKDPRRE